MHVAMWVTDCEENLSKQQNYPASWLLQLEAMPLMTLIWGHFFLFYISSKRKDKICVLFDCEIVLFDCESKGSTNFEPECISGWVCIDIILHSISLYSNRFSFSINRFFFPNVTGKDSLKKINSYLSTRL